MRFSMALLTKTNWLDVDYGLFTNIYVVIPKPFNKYKKNKINPNQIASSHPQLASFEIALKDFVVWVLCWKTICLSS